MANSCGVASRPAEVGHASYEPPQPIQMEIGNPTTPRIKLVANRMGSRKKAGINKTSSRKNSTPTAVKSKEVSEGLPEGWITKIKVRKNGIEQKEVIEMGPADGLPPGWIKELRLRNKRTHSVNEKDSYFVDPTSGYIFRSLLNALRFVETGDIDKCAIKPRKGEAHELEFLNVSTSSPSAVDKKGSTDNTTDRKLFGDENPKTGVESSAEAPQAKNPKSKVSKRKRATKVPAENITLEEEKSPKKRKKEKTITSPGRCSKRLTGVKPEMTINLGGLNELALRAAAKKDGKTDTDGNDFVDYFARSDGRNNLDWILKKDGSFVYYFVRSDGGNNLDWIMKKEGYFIMDW